MMPLSFTKRRLFTARPDGPKPGDIFLFCHATGFSRLIPWFTSSRYYHCALYEGHGLVLEARPSGVVRRDLTQAPDMAFRVIPMPEAEGQTALDYARGCLGSNYDILDVISIILRHYIPNMRFPYTRHDSFVCSELLILAWRKAGIDLFPGQNPALVIPGDFAGFLPPDARDETLFGRNMD